MAVLEREPDNGSGGFGLGPRSMVAATDLAGSGLIAPGGSLFDTHYRLDLPESTDLAAAEAGIIGALDGGAGARWRDARDGGAPGGVRVFVERLGGAFLVLVGLAGLAVGGGVGVSAAVRAFLDGKTATIATLKTLGATGRTIFTVYLMQIGVLTALGGLGGVGLALGGGFCRWPSPPRSSRRACRSRPPSPCNGPPLWGGRPPCTGFWRRFCSRSGRWRRPSSCARQRCFVMPRWAADACRAGRGSS